MSTRFLPTSARNLPDNARQRKTSVANGDPPNPEVHFEPRSEALVAALAVRARPRDLGRRVLAARLRLLPLAGRLPRRGLADAGVGVPLVRRRAAARGRP